MDSVQLFFSEWFSYFMMGIKYLATLKDPPFLFNLDFIPDYIFIIFYIGFIILYILYSYKQENKNNEIQNKEEVINEPSEIQNKEEPKNEISNEPNSIPITNNNSPWKRDKRNRLIRG
jgi:cbb3-type cytochrome oxidase subunit 3